ncbi:MAG: histidine phosphatase family protein [Weeksellaceae bacterium]
MKKIYLVRHGETVGNANHIHQDEFTPLSELGQSQAEFVATRLRDLPFDVMIASPYKRAMQTAKTINKELELELVSNDLFREYSRPSEIQGMSMFTPLSKVVRREIEKNFHNADWHYSDEENFSDFSKRVKQAVTFVEQREEERILIVSHGLFIKMFIALVTFPKSFNSHMFLEWIDNSWHNNTGVSMLEYHEDKNHWRLLTWSDYSHLPA